MNKSKYVFLILFIAYLGIGIGSRFGIIILSNNVLLGLSLSALFMAIGDAVDNIVKMCMWENDYRYTLYLTSKFLEQKIMAGLINNPSIDVNNLKENIDSLRRITKEPMHPTNYGKLFVFRCLEKISISCFVIGVSCFIVMPFLRWKVENDGISAMITIFAFSVMCINLFLNDVTNETLKDNAYFINDKQSVIQSVYIDYMAYYNEKMFHRYNSIMLKESKTDDIENGNIG